MRNDAPILHRSHSTPAPTLLKRASSGTGVQIVPLMLSRVNSEKEVEALSARVQRLASISRCPELIAVARQHSRKAEHDRVVRAAEPVSLIPDWSFIHPRRELEDYPDEDYPDDPPPYYYNSLTGIAGRAQQDGHSRTAEQVRVVRTAEPVMVRRRFWRFFRPRRELEDYPDAERKKEKKLLEKQEQKQKKDAARAEKKKKKWWVAAVQPVLPDGWLLMEQLHGPSYYYHEKSGASQFDNPTGLSTGWDSSDEEEFNFWNYDAHSPMEKKRSKRKGPL